jgi:hypothetical protein
MTSMSYIVLSVIVIGASYLCVRSIMRSQDKKIFQLRELREAFFQSHKERWWLFYHKHKLDDGLNDEEILARYVFVVVGELRFSPLTKTQLNIGWRDDLLDAISAAGPLTKPEIHAAAAKIEREGRMFRKYP